MWSVQTCAIVAMTKPSAESKEAASLPGMSGSNEIDTKFTAGFRLLDKFQNQWVQIHSKDQANIDKAKKVFMKKHLLELSCAKSLQAVDDFVDCYRSLSTLNQQIETIGNDLKSIESYFASIEDLLLVLKNHQENVRAKQYVEDQESLQAEQRRLSNTRKEKLESEHLQSAEALELQQQVELDERRYILEKAFKEDMSRYLERTK